MRLKEAFESGYYYRIKDEECIHFWNFCFHKKHSPFACPGNLFFTEFEVDPVNLSFDKIDLCIARSGSKIQEFDFLTIGNSICFIFSEDVYILGKSRVEKTNHKVQDSLYYNMVMILPVEIK